MRKLRKCFYAVMNCAALALAIQTVNSTCLFCHYQPEVPDGLKKYKKM